MQYVNYITNFIVNNGFAIIILLVIIFGIVIKVRHILDNDLSEWLVQKVMEAEIYFGSETGQIKLRSVYDCFVKERPFLSILISFNTFSNLVDVALEKFEEMLEENGTIRLWIQEKQLKNTEKDATKLAEKMIEQVAEKIDEESEIIEENNEIPEVSEENNNEPEIVEENNEYPEVSEENNEEPEISEEIDENLEDVNISE